MLEKDNSHSAFVTFLVQHLPSVTSREDDGFLSHIVFSTGHLSSNIYDQYSLALGVFSVGLREGYITLSLDGTNHKDWDAFTIAVEAMSNELIEDPKAFPYLPTSLSFYSNLTEQGRKLVELVLSLEDWEEEESNEFVGTSLNDLWEESAVFEVLGSASNESDVIDRLVENFGLSRAWDSYCFREGIELFSMHLIGKEAGE